ncbi:G-protein coupled receptor 126-like [Octopus vulgaris]|uniref:G-protein coupled receptor 126-like n=1 Tax=Octopus vulgaris TaxID=6645 RepID=A0AA36FNM7_OCTVU|nr:G-protein coupled receptor 126-like [Octopus vulgaris]
MIESWSQQKVTQNSSTKVNTMINSNIIAANIPNIKVTNLDEPVNISFNLRDQNATNPQCVFWDESPGQIPKWSTKGCNVSKYEPRQKALCSCDHLTSFALLMNVYQKPVVNIHPLSITSYIGCGISFVCLILTIIIHVCCKNLRKLMASKILVNLCVSLAITNLIFLVGMQPYASKITDACKAVAALLHYFLMTSLMWMAVEALHVFLAAVDVFRTFESHFLLTSSIVAWGVPGVIVIITLVINDTNNYVRIEQVCWLTKGPFYAAFLAPVAIILLFNLTMLFLVILRLISMQRDKHFPHETRKPRILGIVGLISMFGLSWVLAFLAFGEAAQVFQLLLAIFNTLQGMFIFIFYCICKKDARDVICPCLRKENARRPVEPIQTSENSRTAETNT